MGTAHVRVVDPPDFRVERKTFGDMLREQRERSGTSFKKLAEKTRASQDDVRCWEEGEREPTGPQLSRLLHVFKQLKAHLHLFPSRRKVLVSSSSNEPMPTIFTAKGETVELARRFARNVGGHAAGEIAVKLLDMVGERGAAITPDLAGAAAGVAVSVANDLAGFGLRPVPPKSVQVPLPGLAPLASDVHSESRAPPISKVHGALVDLCFADALRSLREKHGLTQEDLGELIGRGLNRTAVTAWEAGSSVPVQEHYAALCDLFPEIRDVGPPKVRNISPPIGQLNLRGTPTNEEDPLNTSRNQSAPSIGAGRLAPMVKDLPVSAPSVQPPKASPPPETEGIATTVRLTRATLSAKRHMAPEVEAFLKLARDLGVTLGEVVELLESV